VNTPTNLARIRGAGGGGGGKGGDSGGHTPTEAPDSLRSRQYARVIDLVAEGEIGGLVNGLASVYLDNTPVINPNGTANFKGVNLVSRNGTQGQSYITGFADAESEIAVSAEFTAAAPLVRSVTNTDVDAVRVTIDIPQLYQVSTSTGDTTGTRLDIAIDVQDNGGGYVAQAVSAIMDSTRFAALTDGTGKMLAESTGVSLLIRWTPTEYKPGAYIDFNIEYRPVSGGAWTVIAAQRKGYGLADFMGASTTFGTMALSPGKGFGLAAGAAGTGLTFALGTYEFRLVQTGGNLWPAQPQDLKITGGSVLVPKYTDTIIGKTISRYQRAYRIPLTGTGPWDIRVRRLTADSASATLINKTYWGSYTQIVDAKFSYPNSALMALSVDASNFNRIPVRGYDIYGLLVRVPSNYDAVARTYTGAWDGTFQIAWTDNPAWCFYDLLTSARYGLGDTIAAAQVDKWALYTIAQYCDAAVDDGYGRQEPRFTCNLYLQTREEAYKVVAAMASIFRAITYWSAGAVTAVQDAPADPIMLFTAANVIDGVFSHQGSSRRTRHTVALVSWNDPADLYRQKVEYVADDTGIARYGINQTEVIAIGCASRGQAHRLGKLILLTERSETETVTFRCGLDGVSVYPGAVIQTADPRRAGKRFGGRVNSATTGAVTLDAAVDIETGKTYTLWCVLPDGSVESRAVTNSIGSASVLTVSPALTAAPQNFAIWQLEASDLQAETWRVVAVSEIDKTQLEITALAYNAGKYAAIEQGLALELRRVSGINVAAPVQPAGLSITESLYLSGLGAVGVKGLASWQSQDDALRYVLSYRLAGSGNWIDLPPTTGHTQEIAPISEGAWEFSVVAVNMLGMRSPAAALTQTIYGKTLAPAAVAGLSVRASNGFAHASWDIAADLDVTVGGYIVFRHTPKTTGAAWEDGVILEYFDGNSTTGVLPLVTGTYMAKALDSSGNWSATLAGFLATEGMITGFTTVATLTEQPAFSGTKSNTAVVASALQLDGALLVDAATDLVDAWPLIDGLGGIAADGAYDFPAAGYVDLTTTAVRRFEADIAALSFDTGDLMDSRTDLIDAWTSFSGAVVDDCDATLYAATTNDNPSGSPAWSAWTPFHVADFNCRAVKFRLALASRDVTHNITITTLAVDIKIPV